MLRRLVLVSVTLLGCSSVEPVARGSSAIVGGEPSPSSQDDVVLLLTEIQGTQGAYVENCTATLVAPNLVITARHCISPTSAGTFVCDADGSVSGGGGGIYGTDAVPFDSLIFVGANAPATFTPATSQAHGVKSFHDSAANVCNDDVALIEITPPITNAPIAPLSFDDAVTKGELLTVVGWGATEDADLPSSRVQRTGVSVIELGPASNTSGGVLGDRELIASESVCSGDSGGPAFDGAGALVAIVSRGPVNSALPFGQGCIGTQHTFMQTAAFHDLIASAFTATNNTLPTDEAGAPDASDDASTSPPPASSGGCALAHGGTSNASVMIAALLLAIGARRRSTNAASTARP